jgi:hypothetical protein
MRRLYEWEVRAGSQQRLSSCGVTDAPLRARGYMLDALSAVPANEVAHGAVSIIELAVTGSCYYFEALFAAERSPEGTVLWHVPFMAPRLLSYADSASHLLTAIDLRRAPR